jgi:NAD(P)-dependent dehydrogenase (short-subunit alcohol dehydrogenase family)
MRLKNRIVVVTGAASGIGRACAMECAAEGARVVVVDINAEGAAETVRMIAAAGGAARAVRTDVSDEASVAALAAEVMRVEGAVHALINNAAIFYAKTVEETALEEWNRQMAVNVGGIFLTSKHFMPYLRASRGAIVNMSSANGYFVEPGCAGYCATKAAIIGLTKAMAIDHGRDGVRVNCICPGYIDTGLAQAYFDVQTDPAQARAEAGKLHALWRIGQPEEIARVAAFLASDDASFITGAAIAADGGFTTGLPPK